MSKVKKFFLHAGLAAAYLALFLLVQVWISSLFSFGCTVAYLFSTGGEILMPTLTETVTQLCLSMLDVIMLLCYTATVPMLFALLAAQQGGLRGVPRAAGLARPRRLEMLWTPLLLGAGCFFAVTAGMSLIPEDAPLMQQYIEASSSLSTGRYPLLSALVTVIGAPIVEEILFRGMIYSNLKKIMPLWLALLVQALLFGLVHGQLLWTAFTFALGLVLGVTADYFDSVWPAILVHLAFNACNYLPIALDLDASGMVVMLLCSLLLVCVLLLVMQLFRNQRQRTGTPA